MSSIYPKTVRIGPTDYEIKEQEGLSAGDSLWGQIRYGNNQIVIESCIGESRKREVFAHELAHGILYEAGYDDHTEEQANRIGKVLAMVLRDNDFGFMRNKEDD